MDFAKVGRALKVGLSLLLFAAAPQALRAQTIPPPPVTPTLPMSKIGTAALISHTTAGHFYGSLTTSTDGLASYSGNPSPTPVAPEIVEQTRALKGNIDLIYQYVRNNIRVSWMYGMQKGGLGALIDKAGTPFDQVDLMVKLLRQANVQAGANYYTVTYEAGTVTLNGSTFTAWTGISDSNAACQMLANGGFPASVNGATNVACSTGSGSAINTVIMDHVWVKVAITAACGCGTPGTYYFDPAYKPYAKITGIANLASAAGMTTGIPYHDATTGMGTATVGSGIPAVNGLKSLTLNGDLQSYAQNLLNYMYNPQHNLQNAQMEDIVGGGVITPDQPPAGGWRQSGLPGFSVYQGTPSSVVDWACNSDSTQYCGVPDQYRTSLGLVGYVLNYNTNGVPPPYYPFWATMFNFNTAPAHANSTNPMFLFVDQIYGRRLTLETDYNAGMGQNGHSQYAEIISLDLDGVPLASYTNPAIYWGDRNLYGYEEQETSRGAPVYVTIAANHPYAVSGDGSTNSGGDYMDTTVTKEVNLITSLTIVDGFGDAGPGLFQKWADERNGDTTNPLDMFSCTRGGNDGLCGTYYPGGTGDFERSKMAANWLSQNTRAAQLHAAIGGGVVQLHHAIGFSYGDTYTAPTAPTQRNQDEENLDYPTPENMNRLDVDSAFSVESRTADVTGRRAMIHSIAATSAALEGSVSEQMDGLPDSSSTATRFEWGNAPPGTPGNWDATACTGPNGHNAYEDPACVSGSGSLRNFLQYDSTNYGQAANVGFVENHLPSYYNIGSGQVGNASQVPQGYYASQFQGAYATEIAVYANCAATSSCGTPGNVPFQVTTSQETELGPGQRGGAVDFVKGTINCIGDDCDAGTVYAGYYPATPQQRGAAFVATAYVSGDPVAIAHDLVSLGASSGPFLGGGISVTKGGGGGTQKDQQVRYSPADAGDILKSRFVDKSNEMGVNLSNGTIGYSVPAKLDVGNGGFPYELSAEVQWHQAPIPPGPPTSPIAPQPGWTTNWNNSLAQSGSGMEAMGKTDARAAVGTIAAFLAEQDIYRQAPGTARDVAALLTQAWWDHQLSGNVVTVTLGTSSRQFLGLPPSVSLPTPAHETWISTGGAYATLSQTNSRLAYEQICTTTHPVEPYAVSRGWDYTDTADGGTNPVEFKVTNAGGDVQTFDTWSNHYATNDFDNCGYAQGFRLTKWTFPQGVTINVLYGAPWGFNGMPGTGFEQLTQVTTTFGTSATPARVLNFTPIGPAGFSSIDDGNGRQVLWNFGLDIFADSFTDPKGNTTTYSFLPGASTSTTTRPVPWEQLFQIYTPDAPALPNTEYDYDTLGRIAQIKDAENLQVGDRAPYQFLIGDGTRGERDDPLGEAWAVDYDTYGHPMKYTDELGNVTLASFDGRGQVVSHTFPEGDGELLQYDDHGNATSIVKTPKPSMCNPTCPANITIQATWDQTWNKLLTLIDANQNETDFQYFGAGVNGASEMQWAKRPAVNGVRSEYDFTYDTAGKTLTATDPIDATHSILTQNTYDSATTENLIQTAVDPSGKNLVTTNTYDAFGNIWYTTDPNQNSAAHNGGTTLFQYDADRRMTYTYHHIGTYTGTLNAASQTLYDALGRDYEDEVAKCFNGSGCPNSGSSVATWVATKTTTFTPTSKEATVTDADGSVTSFTYDAADRKFVTTDPVQRQTELVYDAAGNVLQEIHGLGSPAQITYATYTYGSDGEKTSVQDADGATHITQYAYDGFNRPYQTTFPDSTTETIPLTGGYDANGNILQHITRSTKVFNMTYDVLNRLSTQTIPSYTPPGNTPVPSNTITHQYDLGGRLQSVSDSLANSMVTGYDTAGRPTSTATTIVGLSGTKTAQYQLDPNGNRTQLQWPDGYQVNYAYDTLNQMTTATDSASTVLATYTYDAMSRRTNLAYGNAASVAYAYSDAGDLISLTNGFVTTNKNVVYTLGYTDAHQLASEQNSKSAYRYAPSAGTDSYGTINTLNQYASMTPAGGTAQTLSYDADGNLTGDGAMNLAYDPENRLVLVSGSVAATYAFDPLGRRQTKTFGGAITEFLHDGDNEIAEYDGATGNVQRRFIPGPAINSPIAYENCTGATAPNCSGATGTGVVTEYYHIDHHGGVIAMSGSTGNPVTAESQYTYDAYGNNPNLSTGGQPFRYVGMYLDTETGLYYDRARSYAAMLGRFLQTDPVGYKDDVDLYTYVADDPTDKTDPTGMTNVAADCAGQPTCHETVVQTVNIVHQSGGRTVVDSTVRVTTNFTISANGRRTAVSASSTVENVSGHQYSGRQLSRMGTIAGKIQQAAVNRGLGGNTTQMVTAVGIVETVLGTARNTGRAVNAPSVNPMQLVGGRENRNIDHNIHGALTVLRYFAGRSSFDPRSTYEGYSDGSPNTMANWDGVYGSINETHHQ